MSAGSGRLAVDPRSGTPGGRIGLGECTGLEASGEENGRENNGTLADDEDGILGDWGRGCCTEYGEVKCALVAEDSVRSMKSGMELRRVLSSPLIGTDVGGEEDDDGVLSEDELAALSSKTGLDVSERRSEATQLRRDNLGAGSESSRAEVDAL